MTEKVYLTEPYQKTMTAQIVSQTGNEVEFDRTIIYPGGGGQPMDQAKILQNGQEIAVLGATMTGATIRYQLAQPLDATQPVQQQINWTSRYANMRYHTLLHFLAGTLFREVQVKVTSNQILADHARLEVQFQTPAQKAAFDQAAFEVLFQQLLQQPHAVTTQSVSRADLAQHPDDIKTAVNLVPASVQNIRLVTIAAVDTEACAGTHVANTAEIGELAHFKCNSKGPLKLRFKLTLTD